MFIKNITIKNALNTLNNCVNNLKNTVSILGSSHQAVEKINNVIAMVGEFTNHYLYRNGNLRNAGETDIANNKPINNAASEIQLSYNKGDESINDVISIPYDGFRYGIDKELDNGVSSEYTYYNRPTISELKEHTELQNSSQPNTQLSNSQSSTNIFSVSSSLEYSSNGNDSRSLTREESENPESIPKVIATSFNTLSQSSLSDYNSSNNDSEISTLLTNKALNDSENVPESSDTVIWEFYELEKDLPDPSAVEKIKNIFMGFRIVNYIRETDWKNLFSGKKTWSQQIEEDMSDISTSMSTLTKTTYGLSQVRFSDINTMPSSSDNLSNRLLQLKNNEILSIKTEDTAGTKKYITVMRTNSLFYLINSAASTDIQKNSYSDPKKLAEDIMKDQTQFKIIEQEMGKYPYV